MTKPSIMINPVFRREMRTVFRSYRTFGYLVLYSGILLLVAAAYNSVTGMNYIYARNGYDPQSAMFLYWLLGGFQVGLSMLLVPAFSGGAISSERERQTLDLLLVSKMSRFSIILGKLLSSVMMAAILIVAALPVMSIALYYGSITVEQIFITSLFTLLLAATAGSISILFSALTKKTITSIVVVYLIIVGMTLGNLLLFLWFYVMADANRLTGNGFLVFSRLFVAGNPGFGFMSLMDWMFGTGAENDLMRQLTTAYTINTTVAAAPGSLFTAIMNIPQWLYNIVFNILTIFLSLTIAAKRLNKQFKKK